MSACAQLEVECQSDYLVEGTWFPVYLPHFGSPQGMVIGSIARERTRTNAYVSLVNPEVYSGPAVPELQKALQDWGWFGPASLCPAWYASFRPKA